MDREAQQLLVIFIGISLIITSMGGCAYLIRKGEAEQTQAEQKP